MHLYLEILSKFIDGLFLTGVPFLILSARWNRKWIFIGISACIYACIQVFCLHEFFLKSLSAWISIGFSILFALIFLQGRISAKCLAAVFSSFVILSIHYIVRFICSLITNHQWVGHLMFLPLSLNRRGFTYFFLASHLIQMIILLILYRCRHSLFSLREREEWILCGSLFLAETMITILFYRLYVSFSVYLMELCVFSGILSIILSGIIIVSLSLSMSKGRTERQEKNTILMMNKTLSSSYEQIVSKNEELRKRGHDFVKHLSAMRHMQETDIYCYIDDLLHREKEIIPISHTGDPYVDAVLNAKTKAMEEKMIRFEYSVNLPKRLDIAPSDLCAILMNQIDNAIEASEKLDPENRSIALSINKKGGTVAIICRNRIVPGSVDLKQNARQKGDEHGYGILNIQTCVERNGGTYVNIIEEDSFTSKVLLPEE